MGLLQFLEKSQHGVPRVRQAYFKIYMEKYKVLGQQSHLEEEEPSGTDHSRHRAPGLRRWPWPCGAVGGQTRGPLGRRGELTRSSTQTGFGRWRRRDSREEGQASQRMALDQSEVPRQNNEPRPRPRCLRQRLVPKRMTDWHVKLHDF